jgi:hypothetical protein
VDESETGSANFFGPAQVAGLRSFQGPFHTARLAVALLEKEKVAICERVFFQTP